MTDTQLSRLKRIPQSPTQPTAMETPSDAASRSAALPAPAAGSGHTRARPRHHRAPRGPGSPASARGPEPGACRAQPGGPGLLSPGAVVSGAPRLSRRLAWPPSPRFGPGSPASAVSSHAPQRGDATRDGAPPLSPDAAGLRPEPGAVGHRVERED